MTQPAVYTWSCGAFARFTGIWEFDDFWTRGNTFEACVRFVSAAETKWPTDPAVQAMAAFLKQMLASNASYFANKTKQAWWADDYGWWGIAALTARDYLLSTGEPQLADGYLAIANRCLDCMMTNGYDRSPGALPIPHGCGNGDGTAAGTKNTVTNVNLLLLAMRLFDAAKSVDKNLAAGCLQITYWQYQWFSRWFESSYGYLRLVPGVGGLAQERPIAPPDYENKSHPTWQPGWVWTGDQGLMLGALGGLLEIKADLYAWIQVNHIPGFDPKVFEANITSWIATIVDGIDSLLFAAPDHVLREPPFDSSFRDDPQDYVCGRGVLMRYLAEPAVRPYLGGRFKQGVAATAQAVWDSRDQTNDQLGARWNPASDLAFNRQFVKAWGHNDGDANDTWSYPAQPPEPVNAILQAAGLDVLGAAIPVLA